MLAPMLAQWIPYELVCERQCWKTKHRDPPFNSMEIVWRIKVTKLIRESKKRYVALTCRSFVHPSACSHTLISLWLCLSACLCVCVRLCHSCSIPMAFEIRDSPTWQLSTTFRLALRSFVFAFNCWFCCRWFVNCWFFFFFFRYLLFSVGFFVFRRKLISH